MLSDLLLSGGFYSIPVDLTVVTSHKCAIDFKGVTSRFTVLSGKTGLLEAHYFHSASLGHWRL